MSIGIETVFNVYRIKLKRYDEQLERIVKKLDNVTGKNNMVIIDEYFGQMNTKYNYSYRFLVNLLNSSNILNIIRNEIKDENKRNFFFDYVEYFKRHIVNDEEKQLLNEIEQQNLGLPYRHIIYIYEYLSKGNIRLLIDNIYELCNMVYHRELIDKYTPREDYIIDDGKYNGVEEFNIHSEMPHGYCLNKSK